MRRSIEHVGWGQLNYEIREIVAVAKDIEAMGMSITWENIGDPIQKGEKMLPWIKEIIRDLAACDYTYGYVPTPGVQETREFIAELVNKRGSYQVTAEDIIFFNGLGDAVAKIFGFLRREARVIGPSPAYSTHSSAEASHSGYEHLTYDLIPHESWMPDLTDLENKIKYNDSIAGMLLINPDNPTGAVYPRRILEAMVDIARRYGLFIVSDEIYANIVYNGSEMVHLSQIIHDVPGMALHGISKEYPWPGSRCGWIEVFNKDRNNDFKRYIKSLLNAKMLEVCSTSLPQYSIPKVMGDPRYADHILQRRRMFEARAREAYEIFSACPNVQVVKPQGAFYMTVLLREEKLDPRQYLTIGNPQIRRYIESRVRDVEMDKRFVYYLLGATGICVVPLTGFCCKRKGFRITLLETDDEKRRWTWETIVRNINEYMESLHTREAAYA